MVVVGLIFAVIAGVLTIQQLQLHPGWFVSVAILAAIIVAQFLSGIAKTGLLALYTLAGLSTPILFFVFERNEDRKEIVFYAGAALFFVGSCFLIVRNYAVWSQFEWGNTKKSAINSESSLIWFALIASSIAFSWVAYYRFLTLPGQNEFLVRRLVFTLFFVIVGVICAVIGKSYFRPFLGVTGLIYMAAGVVKALVYDISHTDGVIRIGVFAGSGIVLLLGGFLMMKKAPRSGVAAGSASAFIED